MLWKQCGKPKRNKRDVRTFPATILTKKMLRPLRGEEGELLTQLYVGAVKKQRARPPTLPSTEAPTPLVSHTFNAEHWGSSGTHSQLINAATLD